jgi:hypothetical protein
MGYRGPAGRIQGTPVRGGRVYSICIEIERMPGVTYLQDEKVFGDLLGDDDDDSSDDEAAAGGDSDEEVRDGTRQAVLERRGLCA